MARERKFSTSTTFSVSSGESLSTVVNTNGLILTGLLFSSWDSGSVSFKASDSVNGSFCSLQDVDGAEVVLAGVTSTCAIGLNASDRESLSAFNYLRLRSGTSGSPSAQSGDRSVVAVLRS